MHKESGFQVSGDAAELYEQYSVPYMMGPWAQELVDLATPQAGERVLDLACGTGLLARLAAARVGPTGKVTGMDFNAGMLAVARALPPPSGATIAWLEGSALATNLPDASMDVILCQQGLQFFPDRLAALREMYRVLVPGGRVLLNVWKSAGPYNVAVAKALEQYAGMESATRYRASRVGLPDGEMLHRLLTGAGFSSVEIRPSTRTIRLPSIEAFVLGHLSGMPVAGALAAMSQEERAAFARQVKTALQAYVDGDGVAVPDEVNVAMARR